jgi:putative FmdB family regulatory protein
MPTYQYECGACGHSFEVFQSMTDRKMRKCPSCKAFQLQRLIGTGGGIIFKGSGFYETDYKRTQEKKTDKPPKTPTCTNPSNCACASSE